MSSDLLEDVEDANGVSVMLSMNASGHAFLSLMSDKPIHHSMIGNDLMLDFYIAPTKEGLAVAEKIEMAFRGWREHIQSMMVEGDE